MEKPFLWSTFWLYIAFNNCLIRKIICVCSQGEHAGIRRDLNIPCICPMFSAWDEATGVGSAVLCEDASRSSIDHCVGPDGDDLAGLNIVGPDKP